MKLYDETAHGFRAIAYEFPTLEKAYRQRDKLRKKGYSITDTPRAVSYTHLTLPTNSYV